MNVHLDADELGCVVVLGMCRARLSCTVQGRLGLAVAFTRRALCVCVRLLGNTPKGHFRMAEPSGDVEDNPPKTSVANLQHLVVEDRI